MNNPLFTGTARFCYLIPGTMRDDDRQTAYLSIIEANPTNEEDALAVLRKLHHRTEYASRTTRQRTVSLEFDPPAEQVDDADSSAVKALDLLSKQDQQLITEHVIEGQSLRDIAKRTGLSKDTIRKRFNLAANKLKASRK